MGPRALPYAIMSCSQRALVSPFGNSQYGFSIQYGLFLVFLPAKNMYA